MKEKFKLLHNELFEFWAIEMYEVLLSLSDFDMLNENGKQFAEQFGQYIEDAESRLSEDKALEITKQFWDLLSDGIKAYLKISKDEITNKTVKAFLDSLED